MPARRGPGHQRRERPEEPARVRKVTGFIARNVASVPFHLYERKDDTDRPRVTDHVIAAALGQPRRKVTPYRFWHDVMMDQLLHDRYCITFSVDDRGELVLTRLPANRVRFKENDLARWFACATRTRPANRSISTPTSASTTSVTRRAATTVSRQSRRSAISSPRTPRQSSTGAVCSRTPAGYRRSSPAHSKRRTGQTKPAAGSRSRSPRSARAAARRAAFRSSRTA
ncbi:phage portal protein [Rhodococcus hoagii]|nr:phage portal protein [Prescottella equi]